MHSYSLQILSFVATDVDIGSLCKLDLLVPIEQHKEPLILERGMHIHVQVAILYFLHICYLVRTKYLSKFGITCVLSPLHKISSIWQILVISVYYTLTLHIEICQPQTPNIVNSAVGHTDARELMRDLLGKVQ